MPILNSFCFTNAPFADRMRTLPKMNPTYFVFAEIEPVLFQKCAKLPNVNSLMGDLPKLNPACFTNAPNSRTSIKLDEIWIIIPIQKLCIGFSCVRFGLPESDKASTRRSRMLIETSTKRNLSGDFRFGGGSPERWGMDQ